MDVRIFVTGIGGFLGSHLADALLAAGHEVAGNDNLSGGDRANIPAGADFHLLDCNARDDLSKIMRGCEAVVHTAAAPYEGLSFFSPHYITTNIVNASVSTFSAAIGAGVKRIVHCSSMARYGEGDPPFREDQETKPVDPYGLGKLATEGFLKNLCGTHEVEYVIAVPGKI